MLINPTIDFAVERAKTIAGVLGDKDHQLTARQVVGLIYEYDGLAAAMRVIKHPKLQPAPATYMQNEDTLWAWYCAERKLHESHNASTLCAA